MVILLFAAKIKYVEQNWGKTCLELKYFLI